MSSEVVSLRGDIGDGVRAMTARTAAAAMMMKMVRRREDEEEEEEDIEEGCATPTRGEFRIPEASAPPPPPRKRPFYCSGGEGGDRRGRRSEPPKEGYFQLSPDDLELLFAATSRHRRCRS